MSDRERELRGLITKTTKADVSTLGLDDDVMDALGLDSLAGLRLLAAVEKRFGIRFPDERLGEFRSLRKILEVLASSGGKS